MRLQLIVASLAAAAIARAEPAVQLGLRSGVYQDSDRTFVSTSSASIRGTIKERATLQARYLTDVVSSASADVISSATAKRFVDVRHEAMVGAGYTDPQRSLTVAYLYSIENDWSSHTATLSFSHDLLDHNVTLGLGGSFGYNTIGRRDDPTFQRRLLTGGIDASLTRTLTPRDLLQLDYTFGYADGFQSSPYRFLRAADGLGAWETVPDTRQRHAVTLHYNRHLFRDTALRLHARAYADDWQIASGTVGVEYVIGFGALSLALRARGYGQRHAGFYQETYPTLYRYMSADKEASAFLDGFVGFGLDYKKSLRRIDSIWWSARAEAFGFYYFDFPRLRSRAGVVAELALGVSL